MSMNIKINIVNNMKKIDDLNGIKILALRDQGKSLRQIEAMNEIPKYSIEHYIKRYKQRGVSVRKKRMWTHKKGYISDVVQL